MAQTDSAAGHWEGKVQLPSRDFSISVDLARNGKGLWIGSMSVIGSTSVDVPLTAVAVDGAAVKFKANLPQEAAFSATISEDGKSLAGTASNAAGEASFQLTRSGEADVKVPPPSSPLTKDFEGAWEGLLTIQSVELRLALNLSAAPDGTAAATLISKDQNNTRIDVETVTIDGKQLQFDARSVSGHYKGKLGASGEIAGEWAQGNGHLPLIFRRAAATAPAAKP